MFICISCLTIPFSPYLSHIFCTPFLSLSRSLSLAFANLCPPSPVSPFKNNSFPFFFPFFLLFLSLSLSRSLPFSHSRSLILSPTHSLLIALTRLSYHSRASDYHMVSFFFFSLYSYTYIDTLIIITVIYHIY